VKFIDPNDYSRQVSICLEIDQVIRQEVGGMPWVYGSEINSLKAQVETLTNILVIMANHMPERCKQTIAQSLGYTPAD
jgi:hypothetical protein